MEDLIVIGILFVIVGAAVLYIWKEKKKGTRCIGCPSAGCCSGKGYGNRKASCKCHTDSH
ncbi:MAG: FeoB-associated Cys-rich membrane protein [Lachnospiraceae bacterium]|nr:FeoB-associated Cys-rich membrane protein [Lachnospiraceae bacterium]